MENNIEVPKVKKEKAIQMFKEGKTYKDIGTYLGCSRPTATKYLTLWGFTRKKKPVSKSFKYNVNDIVNGSLKIIKQVKVKENNFKVKGYEVQSLKYPEAPTYIIKEGKLQRGDKDSYLRHRRIFEGNSLYSIEWVRPYIVDIEEAKTIAPHYGKPITFQCPNCKHTKEVIPDNLLKQGFGCNLCSIGVSYPELLVGSVIKYFNLKFKSEQTIPGLNGRRVDFVNFKDRIIIETHGIQHYDNTNKWSSQAIEQDKHKRKWCKENNYYLVELDCRYSSFEYIMNNIKKCNVFPSILEADEINILKIMEKTRKYDVTTIKKLYEEGEKVEDIAKMYGVESSSIYRLLRRHNTTFRKSPFSKKPVKCITTKEYFNSITDAQKKYKTSTISRNCRGKANYAGKHPITGEKLYWEYVEE